MAPVPCEWPEDVDVEASSSDRFGRLPRKHASPDDERDRVIAGFKRLRREVTKAVGHMDVTALLDGRTNTPSWRGMTRQTAREHLDDPAFLERMRAPF